MHYFNELTSHYIQYSILNVHEACLSGAWNRNDIDKILVLNPAPTNEVELKANLLNKAILESVDLRTAYIASFNANNGLQPCDSPDTYIYWDSIHPTKYVHQLLAAQVFEFLKANNVTS